MRNVWSHAIIFCGHFPDQTFMFTEDEVEDETRGAWYVRQLIGAANIDGGPFFHVMAGNLSFQVEHHLYPDMPSSRYQQIAPRVKEICEKYGLPYNTGPLRKQWGTVQRTIIRLAFPGGRRGRSPARTWRPSKERRARRRCRPSRRLGPAAVRHAAKDPAARPRVSRRCGPVPHRRGRPASRASRASPRAATTARAPLVRPRG